MNTDKVIHFFTKQPSGKRADNKTFKYGFLLLFLALLFFQILLVLVDPQENRGNYFGLVAIMMALLGHLTLYFKFGPVLTVLVRIVACLWIISGFFYVLLTFPGIL